MKTMYIKKLAIAVTTVSLIGTVAITAEPKNDKPKSEMAEATETTEIPAKKTEETPDNEKAKRNNITRAGVNIIARSIDGKIEVTNEEWDNIGPDGVRLKIETIIAEEQKKFTAKWDANDDGIVDGEEMKVMLKQRAEEEFAELDTDNNGVLSKEEFLAGRNHRAHPFMANFGMFGGELSREDAVNKGSIERFDENGDGVVDDAERSKAAESMLSRMEQKGLNRKWQKFDKDKNGILEGEEREAALEDIKDRLKK